MELSLPGAKVCENESSCYRLSELLKFEQAADVAWKITI